MPALDRTAGSGGSGRSVRGAELFEGRLGSGWATEGEGRVGEPGYVAANPGAYFGRTRTGQMRMPSDQGRPYNADDAYQGPMREIATRLTAGAPDVTDLFAADAAVADL